MYPGSEYTMDMSLQKTIMSLMTAIYWQHCGTPATTWLTKGYG